MDLETTERLECGVLDSGLSYYYGRNNQPKVQAELRMVSKIKQT